MRRSRATVATVVLGLAALGGGGAGCATTKLDAAKGDIAAEPIEHDNAVVPLTVAVSRFSDETGRKLPKGALEAWTKSYVAVLRNSKVFLDVLPARGASGSPAAADLRVRGRVLESSIYRNYAWISTWIAGAAVTFGYGTAVLPILGVPYASDHVSLALEVRVETTDGRPVATYRTKFRDSLCLNIYSEDTLTGYCQDPRRALQQVIGRSVSAVIDDYAKYRALAEKRAAK